MAKINNPAGEIKKQEFAAVVLAAGRGTRFKSPRPKVMHEILGKPLLYYPVRLALDSGAARVICVVEKDSDEVREYLKMDFSGKPVVVAVQEERLGTAHALHSAEECIPGGEGKVLVLYGADPMMTAETIQNLISSGVGSDLAITTAVLENPRGYGRIMRDSTGKIAGIIEEKDASPDQKLLKEINVGIYFMNAGLARGILEKVGNKNAQKEYYLTDLVGWTVNKGLRVVDVRISDAAELVGVNDRAELAVCAREMARRINLNHMRNGVTIAVPECTWIGPGVVIGTDTVIMPGCTIMGGTGIGASCRMDSFSTITDSVIRDNVRIREYCHIEGCEIGDGAIIGPFARLRPGSVIETGAHVGNFVELKKTRLGKRSKANHLSYLGDAEIGSDVNVGAGTITCNYDGINKHKTIIEDGVFVGSDTQFVAPVKIGKGALIGAGSTITQDVPPDALAVSRVPQSNTAGYAKKRRQEKKRGTK